MIRRQCNARQEWRGTATKCTRNPKPNTAVLPIHDLERKWRALARIAHTEYTKKTHKNRNEFVFCSVTPALRPSPSPPWSTLHPPIKLYRQQQRRRRRRRQRCVGVHKASGLVSASVRKVTATWINRRATADGVGGSFSSFCVNYLRHLGLACICFLCESVAFISSCIGASNNRNSKKWTNTAAVHSGFPVGGSRTFLHREMVNEELCVCWLLVFLCTIRCANRNWKCYSTEYAINVNGNNCVFVLHTTIRGIKKDFIYYIVVVVHIVVGGGGMSAVSAYQQKHKIYILTQCSSSQVRWKAEYIHTDCSHRSARSPLMWICVFLAFRKQRPRIASLQKLIDEKFGGGSAQVQWFNFRAAVFH